MHQVKVKSQHCGNWFLTTTTSRYGLVLRTWRFSPKCLNVHVHHHHLIFCFGLSHAGHAVLIGHSYAVLIGDPWSHTWVVDFCHITTRACLTGFHTRWVTQWYSGHAWWRYGIATVMMTMRRRWEPIMTRWFEEVSVGFTMAESLCPQDKDKLNLRKQTLTNDDFLRWM